MPIIAQVRDVAHRPLVIKEHWKIAYDPRVCHNFDPRSFVQVQGRWKRKIHQIFD